MCIVKRSRTQSFWKGINVTRIFLNKEIYSVIGPCDIHPKNQSVVDHLVLIRSLKGSYNA